MAQAASNGRPAKKARQEDDVVSRLEELDRLQNELERFNDEVAAEILMVERRYNALRQPVYAERQQVIKGIPRFWSLAFQSHEELRTVLDPVDLQILDHLSEVRIVEQEDIKSGYTIKMLFGKNPFFENTELAKEFQFSDEGDLRVVSTDITWSDPSFPTTNPSSFFVLFFDQDSQLESVADVIRENLWTDPLRSYMSLDTTAAD
ncbi:Nucleosome assembly protein (NAP) [Plasmodiophora brassicae]|uniref:Uncharacterized protein n=1 Tax=Plasmodiophora brassicae TaxID=37360 RepID=A0A0G4IPN6_PLABS|nr:hypothetical protein PBRA_000648 [Plasmodiophora brassicae]SPQ97610.1 unnamed protein product [Plasmodiophora brassicae]